MLTSDERKLTQEKLDDLDPGLRFWRIREIIYQTTEITETQVNLVQDFLRKTPEELQNTVYHGDRVFDILHQSERIKVGKQPRRQKFAK